jgi:biotin carboxyl carrier protein
VATWRRLVQRTTGLSVVWLPILVEGRVVAGLWLERWARRRFTADTVARLEPLGLAYGVAWRGVDGQRGALKRWLSARKWIVAAVTMPLVSIALAFVPVPLRIVAPCEIVPKEPAAITAPLSGVIDEVLVLPGRSVEAGDLLAFYDKRVALEELKVAEEQVQIIASDLQRARVQGFDEPAARAEVALLENRLEQEQTRLRIARHRADQLEIRAPVAGTLMLDDPHQWRGRPVQVGERIMLIVDTQRTRVRIRLPQTDNIDFDQDRPLKVILDSDPRGRRNATLRFVASHSQHGPDGAPYFRAEADWIEPQADLRIGLQGTAVLYGDDVSLGYWLLRRPLAAVRKLCGI